MFEDAVTARLNDESVVIDPYAVSAPDRVGAAEEYG
jgi:hypothetical protein